MKYLFITMLAPLALTLIVFVLITVVLLQPVIIVFLLVNKNRSTTKNKSNLSNLLERYRAVKGA